MTSGTATSGTMSTRIPGMATRMAQTGGMMTTGTKATPTHGKTTRPLRFLLKMHQLLLAFRHPRCHSRRLALPLLARAQRLSGEQASHQAKDIMVTESKVLMVALCAALAGTAKATALLLAPRCLSPEKAKVARKVILATGALSAKDIAEKARRARKARASVARASEKATEAKARASLSARKAKENASDAEISSPTMTMTTGAGTTVGTHGITPCSKVQPSLSNGASS